MEDRVSKMAAFVFENGALAQQIVFRHIESEGEIPGVLDEERAAMQRALPLLKGEWLAILNACRQAIWAAAAGHPAAEALRSSVTQPNKMWEKGEIKMPLVPGRADCGVALDLWGQPKFQLHLWVWTQARPRPAAEAAVAHLNPPPKKLDNGCFAITLVGPKEGEPYASIGARVAEALWSMAKPIAEAVAAT